MSATTEIMCNICGSVHKFTRAQNALTRRGCFCKKHRQSDKLSQTLSKFQKWIQESNFELIDDLSQYTNSQQHIYTRCKLCGRIQEGKRVYDYYAGKQCYCQTRGTQKPPDILQAQLAGEYELLEQYTNTEDELLFKHKCGNIVKARVANIIRGHIVCPKCQVISKGQEQIKTYLDEQNILYQQEYRVIIDGIIFRYDFFLPEKNIMIEYNGEQHYRPVEHFGGEEKFLQRQKYDAIKANYCIEQGIPLYVIRYDEDIKTRLSEVI